jgi:phosphate transport system substrate-binding protein
MRSVERTIAIVLILFALNTWASCGYAQEIRIGGTGAGLATIKLLANAYVKNHPGIAIKIAPSLGSSGGIKAVAAGAVQLAVSSRELTGAERKQGLVAVEFGRSPFVFAVSTDNKIDDITLQQVADIYAGKSMQWPDGSRIRLVLRPANEADSTMARSMSPEMAHAVRLAEERPGMLYAVTDQDAQKSIEEIPGAFGVTSLAQIMAEQRQLKALSLNGVRPTPQNLANGSYPHAKVMFLVTGPRTTVAAQRFAEFVQSPAGRDILGRTGYWVR